MHKMKYKIKNLHQKLFIGITIFVLLTVLGACAKPMLSDDLSIKKDEYIIHKTISTIHQNETSQTTLHQIDESKQDKRASIQSGTLRLGMHKLNEWNPLLSSDPTYSTKIPLIYDYLYQPNGYGKLDSKLLVDLGKFSEDGRKFSFTIKPNLHFSDGTPIYASNILSCINLVLNSSTSPYHSALSIIKDIWTEDDYTVSLYLKYRDPFFLYRLQIPICKLPTNEIKAPLGSNKYMFQTLDNEDGCTLVLNPYYTEKEPYIKKINIFYYADFNEESRAFANDEIDLLSVPKSDFNDMSKRQNLTMRTYASKTYYFLNLNMSKKESPIKDPDDLMALKWLLQPENITKGNDLSIELNGTSYPMLPILTGNEFADINTLFFNKTEQIIKHIEVFQLRRPFILAYNEDREIETSIAKQIVHLFKQYAIPIEATGYKDNEILKKLKVGEFDLAVSSAVLDSNPDPSWMYGRSYAKVTSVNWFRQHAFLPYQIDRKNWKNFEGEDGILEVIYAKQFKEFIKHFQLNSPFFGIGFHKQGLLVGARVRGEFRSNSINPFESMEDMWIWSGS